jgi:hypothetical protein
MDMIDNFGANSRQRSRWHSTWLAMMTISLTVILTLPLSACGEKTVCYRVVFKDANCVVFYGPWKYSRVPSDLAFSDRLISVVVTDNGVTLDNVLTSQMGNPILIDTAVSVAHQNILENELISRGLFDSQNQTTWYFQTTNALTVAVGDSGSEILFLSDANGDPVASGTLITMTALESELDLGNPVPNLYIVVDDLQSFDSPVTDSGVLIDQLHITGPIPNQVVLGKEGSITAALQANFDGVPAMGVLFSVISGDISFTSGGLIPEGSVENTSADGLAEVRFVGNAVGPVLVKVELPFSELAAFSFFEIVEAKPGTAAVVLGVPYQAPCPADLAPPSGVLDFFDAAAFLTAFSGGDALADLAPPFGVFDFFDVSAFLEAFSAGCP